MTDADNALDALAEILGSLQNKELRVRRGGRYEFVPLTEIEDQRVIVNYITSKLQQWLRTHKAMQYQQQTAE